MNLTDSQQFNVDLINYSGPLDVLLDLAKSQKVDLEKISVTKLADQFHTFITTAKDINLELASDYLLMATWLTYLKSKLLLPESDEEEFKILEVAEKLKLQLKKLELIRLLSDQLLKTSHNLCLCCCEPCENLITTMPSHFINSRQSKPMMSCYSKMTGW